VNEVFLTLTFMAILFFFLGSGVWVALSLTAVSAGRRRHGDHDLERGLVLVADRAAPVHLDGRDPVPHQAFGKPVQGSDALDAALARRPAARQATVATVGKMSIPELRKRRYPERMIVGTLAGAGTLGLLIPPSITLIIYGVTVNESIAKLFIAGILPGILLALMFMGYTALWAVLKGQGGAEGRTRYALAEKLHAALLLLPVFLLILAVMGSIYLGLATATEAAVLGVVGALILSALQGSLDRASFMDSLLGATRTSAMIAFILAGSAFLSLAMGFTGLPRALAIWIGGMELSAFALVAALTVFYIVLGCFLDGISAVVLTMAVIEPLVRQAGFDMIWFGIYLMIVVEMAQITPPIGFNLFVLQGMTGHDMGFIARAAVPFFGIMILAVAVLVAVPEIATFLPGAMATRP
jgi:tripartite ATP-independent transporter DctM subunit